MPLLLLTLAMIALAGFCSYANARAQCSDLARFRSEAAKIVKKMTGVPAAERCGAHNRFSMVWSELLKYATGLREHRAVSDISLSEFDQRHREAVKARDNVCVSRPLQPFPPEIIRR